MKLILKTILKFKPNDEGSAIPIVMALGLLMTFIGILGIFKANEEEVAAISQKNRTKALAAAEKGINDYRLLFDRNKRLALYDQINHTSNTTGWRTSGIPLCDNKTNIIDTAINNGGWININGNERFGQYRIIGYNYNQADNTFPNSTSEAQLTVEGKAGTATARLQVDIPIQPATAQRALIPALWLNGESTNNNLTGVTIGDSFNKGDLLLLVYDQSTATASKCDTLSTGLTGFSRSTTFSQPDNQNLIIEPFAMADINSGITTTVNDASRSASFTVNSATFSTNLPTFQSTPYSTLPSSFSDGRTIASFKGNGSDNTYYHKSSGSLTITKSINTQNNIKVVLYVDGNLTFDSSSNAIDIGTNTTTNDSAYLEIYVVGNRTITFKGSNEINIKGFIHAPNSNVVFEGSSATKIIGALWANSLKRSGGTRTMNIIHDTFNTSTASNVPAYARYSSASNIKISTISPPDQWRMQEVR
jgi:hypothetical protein